MFGIRVAFGMIDTIKKYKTPRNLLKGCKTAQASSRARKPFHKVGIFQKNIKLIYAVRV